MRQICTPALESLEPQSRLGHRFSWTRRLAPGAFVALMPLAAVGAYELVTSPSALVLAGSIEIATDATQSDVRRRQAMHCIYLDILKADKALREVEREVGPDSVRLEACTILDQFRIRLERRDRSRVPFVDQDRSAAGVKGEGR